MPAEAEKSDAFLLVIAIFKLIKATLFFAAAVGLLHLMNKDVETWLQNVMDYCHVPEESTLAQWCLDKAGELTKTKIATISVIAFCYSCLFATEGLGLYFRKRWAEYLVVVMTASLLPLEIYELWISFHWVKILVMVLNLIILGYLIHVLRKKKT